MRRLLGFDCDGEALGATIDEAAGDTGILMVSGGGQTRIGSHRMSERLAATLAAAGYPVFRFDRRGVGDSAGEDPGFRGNRADIDAAIHAFRRTRPGLRHMVGFGLCDGATSLALFGASLSLDGIILANPWLVEAEAGAPPAAAIRSHYADRLRSREGWSKLVRGDVSVAKLARGVARMLNPPPSDLAGEVVAALSTGRLSLALILARKDATGIAAADVWNGAPYRAIRARSGEPVWIDSDSHTFAHPGDEAALAAAILAILRRF